MDHNSVSLVGEIFHMKEMSGGTMFLNIMSKVHGPPIFIPCILSKSASEMSRVELCKGDKVLITGIHGNISQRNSKMKVLAVIAQKVMLINRSEPLTDEQDDNEEDGTSTEG